MEEENEALTRMEAIPDLAPELIENPPPPPPPKEQRLNARQIHEVFKGWEQLNLAPTPIPVGESTCIICGAKNGSCQTYIYERN